MSPFQNGAWWPRLGCEELRVICGPGIRLQPLCWVDGNVNDPGGCIRHQRIILSCAGTNDDTNDTRVTITRNSIITRDSLRFPSHQRSGLGCSDKTTDGNEILIGA